MKKLLGIVVLGLLWGNTSFAGYGAGELTMSEGAVLAFQKYLKGKKGKPMRFLISEDGLRTYWWYCPYPQCTPGGDTQEAKICSRKARTPCHTFAVRRSVKWKNQINPGGKASSFASKYTNKYDLEEIKKRLTELGFYNAGNVSKPKKTITKKPKKQTKASKTSTGKRSLAMSWEGYDNLIVGSLQFNEKDLVGSISVNLPNNDGNCKGTYALSTEKGTWSLLCKKKNMSASGTLKWNNKDGSVTGEGKDAKGKEVKFTVQGAS